MCAGRRHIVSVTNRFLHLDSVCMVSTYGTPFGVPTVKVSTHLTRYDNHGLAVRVPPYLSALCGHFPSREGKGRAQGAQVQQL